MESFPRRQARTRRFTLGAPRGFSVVADGERVVFLRSRSGTDPVTCLWVFDVESRTELLVADPRVLLGSGDEALPAAERARRERTREQAGGIVAYSTDGAGRRACFALGGRLFVADLVSGDGARELAARSPVVDPRLAPDGESIAYLNGPSLRVIDVASGSDRELAAEDGVSWGAAEFIAAEEMGRSRGFWWAPGSTSLLVARVDESPVQRWWIADASRPEAAPHDVAYPAAGTPNALVTLTILGLDGSRTPVSWDTGTFPYLVRATWREGQRPLIGVQSRDQRALQWLDIEPSGATSLVHEQHDPNWVEIVPGSGDRLSDGRFMYVGDDGDTRRLFVDGAPVTPDGVQVRAVLDVYYQDVLLAASTEPTEVHVWAVFDGEDCAQLTSGPGIHTARGASDRLVVSSRALDRDGADVFVRVGADRVATIGTFAEDPGLSTSPVFLRAGGDDLRTAVLLPTGHVPGSAKLPVLLDPYGGPHAQRVLASRDAFHTSQWFADQGFAVVVADGHGTPGRGPAWEKAVAGDLATAVLDDQVTALHAAAERFPDLDLTRVAIRGWSFGGYLAALAVLRRPDIFHAAVAGAPVTDWRLYDTHYTERYLGTEPSGADAEAYDHSSLLADAASLARPLLLIHGLADDNVVAAHTLRLSAALMAAGRPHTVLPLSGVTHMTPQEDVAENLLLLQLDFLQRALSP